MEQLANIKSWIVIITGIIRYRDNRGSSRYSHFTGHIDKLHEFLLSNESQPSESNIQMINSSFGNDTT